MNNQLSYQISIEPYIKNILLSLLRYNAHIFRPVLTTQENRAACFQQTKRETNGNDLSVHTHL